MSETRTGYFEGTGSVKLYYEDTGDGVPIVFIVPQLDFIAGGWSVLPEIFFCAHPARERPKRLLAVLLHAVGDLSYAHRLHHLVTINAFI